MGDIFGMGGGGGQEQQSYAYYPSFNPYAQLGGEVGGQGAQQLLAGQTGGGTGTINSPEFSPTGGWAGAGNAALIPGAATQLLGMRSPQYVWF